MPDFFPSKSMNYSLRDQLKGDKTSYNVQESGKKNQITPKWNGFFHGSCQTPLQIIWNNPA